MTRTSRLAIVGLVAAGCVVMVATRAFLFGEASEVLVDTLEHGVGYRVEIARLMWRPASWLPILPMIGLSYVTSELRPLVYAFGIGHALIPVLATAGVVWALRHRDESAGAMAVMGVTLLGLVAPVFVASGQIWVAQLFWVVLAGIVNWDSHPRWRAGTLVLAVLLLAWSPVAAAHVGATGVFLMARAMWPGDRHVARFRLGAAFAAAALLRAFAILFSSEFVRVSDPNHPSLAKLLATLSHPHGGWMVAYFVAIVAAAACLAARRRWSGWLAIGLVCLSALALAGFWQATGVEAVSEGTLFLAWIVCAAPVMHALFLHTALRTPAPSTFPSFPVRALGMLCAAVFVCVVGRASFRIAAMTDDVHAWAARQADVCIAAQDVPSPWTRGLGGNYDGFEYIFLASSDSSTVRRVVLAGDDCQRVCESPEGDPHPLFWLDLSNGIRPPSVARDATACPLTGVLNERR